MGTKGTDRDQSHAVIAVLQCNADWDAVPSDIAQQIIDDPQGSGQEFTRFLQHRGRVQIATAASLIAPPKGRIRILSVPVNESRNWDEAVRAAGPNTLPDYNVWKVGDKYPAKADATSTHKEVILVNFGERTTSEANLRRGKERGLCPATSRACFAVGEHHPTLNKELGMDPMAVVSLVPCSFGGKQLCSGVWWAGAGRKANLVWFTHDWHDCYWFAFVRE